eukprot:GFKZ01005237.1.p1 GENE.GFKZ01005237.1~~GFKZ01005237.1.p1  ORF type:complete len:596 (+),score=79.27 GFKZ01005237.1:70-1857(+)
MRTARGRGNDARKILTYYSINFDVHAPFQVLCDGPMISLSLRNNLYLKQSLPKLLGSTAYPVVTDCIVSELKSLGEEFSGAALFAKRLTRIPCANDTCSELDGNASACILARLRKQDDFRLMLATNDTEIMHSLANLPGVPLITVEKQTKLVLRPPPRETLECVRRTEGMKGTLVSASDVAFLEKVRAEAVAKMPPNTQRRELRKRKRAKGPNPLSVKKAKRAKATHDGPQYRLSGFASRPPGKTRADMDSECVKEDDLVRATAADVKSVERPDHDGGKPVPDIGKDYAEQVGSSNDEKITSQAPLSVSSKDKAKRRRARNRKTCRNSKLPRAGPLENPDSRNQVISNRRAGDGTRENDGNQSQRAEVSQIPVQDSASGAQQKLQPMKNETQTFQEPRGKGDRRRMEVSNSGMGKDTGDNVGNESPRTEVPQIPVRDSASGGQEELQHMKNETRTFQAPRGKGDRHTKKVSTSDNGKDTRDGHRNFKDETAVDFAGEGGYVAVHEAETKEPAFVAVQSTGPKKPDTTDTTALGDSNIGTDDASSKIPARACGKGERVVEEGQKKKKHRNNRRRRPKKTQNSFENQVGAPTIAEST